MFGRTCLLCSLLAFGGALAAVGAEPGTAEQTFREAQAAAAAGRSADAVDLLTQVIAGDPKLAGAYYARGREQFRLGRPREAVADFDKFVELRPELESRQWERGIAYYYAGEYEKGAKQFALYQTFHNADVENAAWRYLCVARASGVEKARASILPIEGDARVPMREIYKLYRGELTPEKVLEAAQAGAPGAAQLNQQLFYAHLYVGLYYEAQAAPLEAKNHVTLAEQHRIGHYMWDVAHIHAERLREEGKK